MNRYKRPLGFQYYFRMFSSAVIAVLVVGVISEFFGWPTEGFIEAINTLLPLPFLVVIFLFIFNTLNRRFQKPSKEREKEHAFLMRTSNRVRDELEYDKDKFKEIQNNQAFQNFYQQAFTIFKEGESEALTLESISQEFNEDDPAYEAVQIVVDETRNMLQERSEEQNSTEETTESEQEASTSDNDSDPFEDLEKKSKDTSNE